MRCYIINSSARAADPLVVGSRMLSREEIKMFMKMSERFAETLKKEKVKGVKLYGSHDGEVSCIMSVLAPILERNGLIVESDVIFDGNLNTRVNNIVYGQESKNAFKERVCAGIAGIADDNAKPSNIVIVAAEDVIKLCQTDSDLRKVFFFGDEKLKPFTGAVSKSTRKFPFGRVEEVEFGMPVEVGYDGEIKTIAEEGIKRRDSVSQKQPY